MAKGYEEEKRRSQTAGTYREGGIDAHKTIESAAKAYAADVKRGKIAGGEGATVPKVGQVK